MRKLSEMTYDDSKKIALIHNRFFNSDLRHISQSLPAT